jgi:putative (di)nucleoside polyphosphate hydrolase
MSVTGDKADNYRMGVGVMLLNARGQVLIGRRADVEGGAWQMPQGGIEKGEAPRVAVRRELTEEIGTDNAAFIAESPHWRQYDLPPALVGRAWGGRYVGQRLKWFLMRFNGRDEDISVETRNPEFSGWIWVPPDHVSDLVVAFKRPMYEAVLAEFRGMNRPGGRTS